MTARPNIKLCWNCESEVSFKDENCPFCGVYLSPSEEKEAVPAGNFSPPYQLPEEEELSQQQAVVQQPTEEKLSSEMKLVIVTLTLLSAGALFLLFGSILLLFSQEGFFTLQWNASYWYVYLIGGIAMLVLGWRALERFSDDT